MSGIDIQPTLEGAHITLRPLREEDFPAIYQAASDPVIWEQHPDSRRYQKDIFEERFFRGAIASQGALAVLDRGTGDMIGCTRYYEWDSEQREIAIGYTFLARSHWGNGTNDEMKALMLHHIFQFARVIWLHVGETNMRSRRAVEKLGAVHAYSKDRELDGRPFVQYYYRLTPADYAGRAGA